VDLDAPAGDADFLDDESQEASAAFGVEVVECGGDLFGEAGEPSAEPVFGRELGAAASEDVLFLAELVAPSRDRGGSVGELVEFEQSGLIGIE
jgi:hypothetical protein